MSTPVTAALVNELLTALRRKKFNLRAEKQLIQNALKEDRALRDRLADINEELGDINLRIASYKVEIGDNTPEETP